MGIEATWRSVCRRNRVSPGVARIVSQGAASTGTAIVKRHASGLGVPDGVSIVPSHMTQLCMLASDGSRHLPITVESTRVLDIRRMQPPRADGWALHIQSVELVRFLMPYGHLHVQIRTD